jgi:hypothetical protein
MSNRKRPTELQPLGPSADLSEAYENAVAQLGKEFDPTQMSGPSARSIALNLFVIAPPSRNLETNEVRSIRDTPANEAATLFRQMMLVDPDSIPPTPEPLMRYQADLRAVLLASGLSGSAIKFIATRASAQGSEFVAKWLPLTRQVWYDSAIEKAMQISAQGLGAYYGTYVKDEDLRWEGAQELFTAAETQAANTRMAMLLAVNAEEKAQDAAAVYDEIFQDGDVEMADASRPPVPSPQTVPISPRRPASRRPRDEDDGEDEDFLPPDPTKKPRLRLDVDPEDVVLPLRIPQVKEEEMEEEEGLVPPESTEGLPDVVLPLLRRAPPQVGRSRNRSLAEQVTRVPAVPGQKYRNSDKYRQSLARTPREPGCLAKTDATVYDPVLKIIRPKYKPGPKKGRITPATAKNRERLMLMNAMRRGERVTKEQLVASGVAPEKADALLASGLAVPNVRRAARSQAVKNAESRAVAASAACTSIVSMVENPALGKGLNPIATARALLSEKDVRYDSPVALKAFLKQQKEWDSEKMRRRQERAAMTAMRRMQRQFARGQQAGATSAARNNPASVLSNLNASSSSSSSSKKRSRR